MSSRHLCTDEALERNFLDSDDDDNDLQEVSPSNFCSEIVELFPELRTFSRRFFLKITAVNKVKLILNWTKVSTNHTSRGNFKYLESSSKTLILLLKTQNFLPMNYRRMRWFSQPILES